mgnify:CR=1 FL=1
MKSLSILYVLLLLTMTAFPQEKHETEREKVFIGFYAEQEENTINLRWSAEPVNFISLFRIEHHLKSTSEDTAWVEIASVPYEVSEAPKLYMVPHTPYTQGDQHYRLTAIDTLGQPYEVFYTELYFRKDKFPGYKLEAADPNPFLSSTVIRFTVPAGSRVLLELYSLKFKQAKEVVFTATGKNLNEYEWDLSDLDYGVYYCRMKCGDFVDVIKLVKGIQ